MKNRIMISIIFLMQTFLLFSQQSKTVSTVYFDGLYQTKAEIDSISGDTSYYYLRFYSSGKVISVVSTGIATDLKKWFNIENKENASGVYNIDGTKITFSTTDAEGTIVFDGEIIDKFHLELSEKSLINEHYEKQKYYFVKVEGLK